MIELLCKIPDHIGWVMVGFVGCLALVMAVKLGKVFVEMWKDRHEEEEEDED